MKPTALLPLLAAVIAPVAAQTSSLCDPTKNSTCAADPALGVANYTMSFEDGNLDDTVWNQTAGTLNYNQGYAIFPLSEKGDSATVQSNFYIFFGVVEVIMKAASGQGIISTIVLESDDLDEVDIEIMGGNTTHVESNYFGKGNHTTYDRAIYHPVDNPQGDFHNYTVVWTADHLQWIFDGTVVRTLLPADAVDGKNYPQTPMNIRIGIWAGGDASEPPDTIAWAGGPTDYSKGPFDMSLKSIRATDYSRGTAYQYADKSGTWQSIKAINPTQNSTIAAHINAPPPETLAQKWANLPNTTKYIIYGSVAGLILISGALLTWCCISQRRAGRRERVAEEAAIHKRMLDDNSITKDTLELMAHRAELHTGGHGYERGYR